MTGYETIIKLRKLEQHRDGNNNQSIFTFLKEMQKNVDLLLSIAEAFQPGNTERLRWVLEETADTGSILREMIKRLQVAAERLEK